MNIEIHKPELVQGVNAHIRTGHFHDADELLEKALDALDEQATGAVVLAALQARPYPDIDLTPPRVRLTNVRDVGL
jgi:predicted hydrolase (HD superfamily)